MMTSIGTRDERAARFLAGTVASNKFPGVQYVAVSAKERLFEYDGGLADVENAIPMTPATTMMAYSMTKTYTAAAVLQLVEQGKVSLDESVLNYLPAFPYGPAITVRHLLSQTSGLPNPIPLRWAHPVSRDPSFDEPTALREVMAAHPKLAFAPGKRYGYSNLSYWLLGAVIERTAGEPYQSYMERRMIAPLGLKPTDAGFSIVDASAHAKGYLARRSIMNLMKRVLLDKELIGHDFNFIYLDLTNTAQIRGLERPEATYMIFCQAEDREFDELGAVFRAITTSLLSSCDADED